MRATFLSLAAAALFAAPGLGQSWGAGGCQPAPAPVRSEQAPACCVRVVSGGNGVTGQGSGTVVRGPKGSRYVLTCKHAVEGFADFTVHCGARGLKATVLRTDAAADLALLKVAEPLPHAVLADRDARPGELVRSWGFGDDGFNPTAGLATGPASAATANRPGDSGAGVFDAAGKLVGVVCAVDVVEYPGGRRAYPNVTHRVPLADVRRFLDACACDPCDCSPCDCVEKLPQPRKKTNAQFPPGGVNREAMTPAGGDKFCVNGQPCPDFETFRAAMLGADDRLVDDSDWPYVYVIGPEADRERVFRDFAEHAELARLNVRLKGYPRDHPMVADYGPGLLHVQAANGRPLLSLDRYEGADEFAARYKTALAAYDPAKDPGPGKPYPKDEPEPDRPDDPAPQPAPQVPAWVYVVGLIALAYLILSAKRS